MPSMPEPKIANSFQSPLYMIEEHRRILTSQLFSVEFDKGITKRFPLRFINCKCNPKLWYCPTIAGNCSTIAPIPALY